MWIIIIKLLYIHPANILYTLNKESKLNKSFYSWSQQSQTESWGDDHTAADKRFEWPGGPVGFSGTSSTCRALDKKTLPQWH